MRRAETHAGLGHPGVAGAARGERDAEVGHQRAAVVQQDVLGLDVAVNHPVPVGVVERVGHLAGDPDGVPDRELPLPLEPVPQRLALDERHHVVEEAVGDPGVEQRKDVRVLQVRGGPDLRQEPLGPDDGGQIGPEDLDGHLPVVLAVVGEVDGRHAALAELALDLIGVGQRGLQATEGIGHWARDGVRDEPISLAAGRVASYRRRRSK